MPAGGSVERLRRVKDEAELAAIAAAAELADDVWRWSRRARPRRPHRARGRAAPPRRGSASSAPSPPSRRSSPPARTARCRTPSRASATIGEGELVVFDMGAKLDGYCSDGTRTFATGEPGEQAREVYELVREAQAAALEAIAAGRRRRGGRRRRPRADRGGGPRRALRPRARPRRRPRGPRGRRASRTRSDDVLARRGSGHGRARASTCRASWACGSRISSSSPRTATAISAAYRKSWRSSPRTRAHAAVSKGRDLQFSAPRPATPTSVP